MGVQLYTFAEGSPNPERQLEQLAESLFLAEEETVDACGWFSLIRQSVETTLDYARYQLKKAWQMADEGEFGGYHKLLTNEVAMVENFAAALQKGYADWRLAYLAIDFARLPAYRGEEKETAERIKALRNEAKDTIKKLQEAIFAYSPEMQADLVRRLLLELLFAKQNINRDNDSNNKIKDFTNHLNHSHSKLCHPQIHFLHQICLHPVLNKITCFFNYALQHLSNC